MNENNVNNFMQDFAELYTKTNNSHMDVIRRYEKGLLSFDAYKELDNKYTIELEVLVKVKNIFLLHKITKL